MSVYISQLPLYTGNTYNGYIIWNDSGETTTYKTLFQPPFKYTNGTDKNIVSTNFDNTAVDGLSSTIIGGSNSNYITTPNTLGQSGHTIMNSDNSYINFNSGSWPGWSGIYSAQNAYINGSAWGATIIGGYDNYITTSPFAIVLGGQSNRVRASSGTDNFNAARSAIVGGYNNEIVATGSLENSGIFAGNANTISDGAKSGIFAGETNTINADQSFIGGGYSNTIASGNEKSVILGGRNNITNNSFAFIGGGAQNTVGYLSVALGGFNLNVSNQSSAINGENNTASAAYGGIFGGINNTASGNYSTIIGSNNSNTNNQTRAIMLGTSGRTANADNTTYTENLHIYRTPSTQVQSVSSGTTFTCNLENGAKSQFYITGTSTINITNVRDGASFMIKTQTNGNYTMTWTATGYTFVFEGGIKDPGNNVTDIFVFEVFGSVIYGNRRHNYS